MCHFTLLSAMFWLRVTCNLEHDETTLLQLKSHVQVQLSHAKKGIDHKNHKMLLESVENMARHLSTSPEEVIVALGPVIIALNEMAPLLDAEHQNAQSQIQQQLEEIQACHASTLHGTAQVSTLGASLDEMDDCHAAQVAAAAAQEQACTAWNTEAVALAFPPCAVPASSATAEQIYSTAQTWAENSWPLMQSLRSQCTSATAFAYEETQRCSSVLNGYEDTFCMHHLACTLLNACHSHEVEVYESLRTNSLNAMALRQDQYRSMTQAKCIVDAITDALNANATVLDSALNSCDDNIDVSHLELSFPTPQDAPACETQQAGQPQCPHVELPEVWTGGAAGTSGAGVDGLVVFDSADDSLIVSPGTVSPSDSFHTGWRQVAVSAFQVSEGDGTCGISFKCNTERSHLMLGITSQSAFEIYKDLDFGVCCRGRHVDRLDVYQINSGGSLHGSGQIYDRPNNGNPETDVLSLFINSEGKVDFGLNGEVYTTSTEQVKYPWHVAFDSYQVPSLAEVRYLPC